MELKSINDVELFPAKMKYCLKHLGHNDDVGKLSLSREEKYELAGQIMIAITPQNIVCNIAGALLPFLKR